MLLWDRLLDLGSHRAATDCLCISIRQRVFRVSFLIPLIPGMTEAGQYLDSQKCHGFLMYLTRNESIKIKKQTNFTKPFFSLWLLGFDISTMSKCFMVMSSGANHFAYQDPLCSAMF
jgi:hypothetical protein